MYLAWEKCDMRTKFWSKNMNGRDESADLGVDGKLILEWFLGK
jgi:hypothetical protein